jgi:hypothetical protein
MPDVKDWEAMWSLELESRDEQALVQNMGWNPIVRKHRQVPSTRRQACRELQD